MRFPLRAYFYPRPPRGGRRFVEFFIGKLAEFLSTPSARRATKAQDLKRAIELISIHALREEGDGCAFSGHRSDTISIHALREEGDPGRDRRRRWSGHFYPRPPRGGRHAGEALRVGSVIISIHALREEGDLIRLLCMANSAIFLSTPSARRATTLQTLQNIRSRYFYPRPPRGGRRKNTASSGRAGDFYPRPPRGGRPSCSSRAAGASYFYPRPPRGGRRVQHFLHGGERNFYPRPPRGGRLKRQIRAIVRSHFYPRPPRGGRPSLAHLLIKPVRFLSTPSARRATRNPGFMWRTSGISIHALREEGDAVSRTIMRPFCISLHALREEGDRSSGRQPQQW